MAVSENRSIAVVGVGSLMSKSLVIWLAGLGWNIALVSRSEKSLSAIADEVRCAQKGKGGKVVYRAADASDPVILKATLGWCVEQLGGKLDVLNYNAARVASTSVTDMMPDDLEKDFKVSAVGTLVAGQWFADSNARVDRVSEGEWPLFLVTGGVLDKVPEPSLASLSTVKSASQTLSRLFAMELPEKSNILVGMPLISGRVVNRGESEYTPRFDADTVIAAVFRPFFEDRENRRDGKEGWTVERVY
ncbi:short-chain dehydrogenase reductase sdr [Colletotrichum truncatum]|uniref:Short-chain dehydrogenase reductase sdr n=1 Tax=Colletotrichum truncatum TaxID=5467 RepID=A0ACC3Z2A5_COLTU|nr:short-chain dehydrogenase reductase sdr [Colletotrichum truncatum]KAF6786514.1 short-chain dehydrogenase reductase sdr [Colletotrichum truncatum]